MASAAVGSVACTNEAFNAMASLKFIVKLVGEKKKAVDWSLVRVLTDIQQFKSCNGNDSLVWKKNEETLCRYIWRGKLVGTFTDLSGTAK